MIHWYRTVWAAFLAVLITGAAVAAPDRSLRPMPRPGVTNPDYSLPRQVTVQVRYDATIRPRPRPLRAARPAQVIEVSSAQAVGRSIRPEARPARLRGTRQAVVRRQPDTPEVVTRGGKLCGDKAIRGDKLSRIRGDAAGCGVAKPVRVTSISGVALSTPATMDCDTARALKAWVKDGVKPAVGRLGGGVKSLRVVASYSCRTRNSRPGAKISEHGKGKAVDIAAITLNNGISLTVLKGWRDPVQGKLLKRMHKSACGPFGTVLGPNSDKYHQDHFHLDTANYRSGPYCR